MAQAPQPMAQAPPLMAPQLMAPQLVAQQPPPASEPLPQPPSKEAAEARVWIPLAAASAPLLWAALALHLLGFVLVIVGPCIPWYTSSYYSGYSTETETQSGWTWSRTYSSPSYS